MGTESKKISEMYKICTLLLVPKFCKLYHAKNTMQIWCYVAKPWLRKCENGQAPMLLYLFSFSAANTWFLFLLHFLGSRSHGGQVGSMHTPNHICLLGSISFLCKQAVLVVCLELVLELSRALYSTCTVLYNNIQCCTVFYSN